MLKAKQVPHGLALIARRTFHDATGPTTDDDWNAAIAAAINAWPGVDVSGVYYPCIILPLPQEASDE